MKRVKRTKPKGVKSLAPNIKAIVDARDMSEVNKVMGLDKLIIKESCKTLPETNICE
jgi:hypothetical protein